MQPEHFEKPGGQDRSIAALFRQLSRDLGTLLRQESELARTEMREKVGQFGTGVSALGAGALVAFAGFLVLLDAAVYGMNALVDSPALAALIVGGVTLVVGVLALAHGRSRLKAEELVPKRTVESLRQDAALAGGDDSPPAERRDFDRDTIQRST